MLSEKTNTPGIHVIPPFVYLIALLTGYGLELLWPVLELRYQWTLGLAVVAMSLSAFYIVSAMVGFRRAATPFDVRKAATALVTDGPYRYSRNPGYLALSLLYGGIAILLGSVWMLLLLVPVHLVMNRWVIEKEEQHLEQVFGEAYLQYKAKVGRWL